MPLQLIEFLKTPTEDDPDSSTIKVQKENLNKVLQQCGNRPLCIICICGPSRQGKSFILGHIIRCFDAIEKDQDDWMEWDNPKKPLDKGFTWQNAYGPVTQGIWIWERPFFIKSNDGQDCAVLLIDTQGTYDEFTSNKDMTAIVGLSLLMSSVMIFNFFTNLQEDILSSLGTYIEYGLIAVNDAKAEKPFQKLKFLIRDWNNPTEFAYGKHGGEKFIKKKLEIKDNQPESAQKVRKTIKKCFEDLTCFLMPAIGDKALAKDYDGNIAALNRNFATKMQEFITELSIKELVIKKVLGSHVTAKELVSYMDTYVETFNNSTIPSAMSMWEATTLVANNSLLEKSKKAYQDKMRISRRGRHYLNPDDFEEAKEEAENEALSTFRKGQKYGDNVQSFENSLKEFIDNEGKVNEADNQAKRANTISSAEKKAKQTFDDQFSEKFDFENEDVFWEDGHVQSVAQNAIQTALDEFEEPLQEETDAEKEHLKGNLENHFDTLVKEVKLKNILNQKNASKKINDLVEELADTYKEVMNSMVEKGNFDNAGELHDIGISEKENILEEFDNQEKPGGSEFHLKFRAELDEKLEKAWAGIETKFKVRLNELNEQADKLICTLVKEYNEFLQQATKVNMITQESKQQLNEDHKDWLQDFHEKFQKEGPFSENSNSIDTFQAKLEEQLNFCLAQALERVQKHFDTMQKEIDSLLTSALQLYEKEIAEATNEYWSNEELENKHQHAKSMAMKQFQEDDVVSKSGMLDRFEERLSYTIMECFNRIKTSNDKLGEIRLAQAKTEVHESLAAYKQQLSIAIENLKFENGKVADLQPDHDTCRQNAEQLLRDRCKNLDTSKLNELLQELDELILKTYEEQKKIVELKELEMKSAVRDILNDARRYYHGEMQKNIDQEVYLEPSRLTQVHEKILQTAISQFGSTLEGKHIDELKFGLEQSFLKYREENSMKFNSEAADVAIGIDLGTTYCCVGAYYKGAVRIIKNSLGANLTPSYLALCPDGSEKIGELAKKGAFLDPENTIYDAKRMIGRKWEDEKLQHDITFWPFNVVNDGGVPKIQARGNTYYPEQISAKLLKHLKNEAEKELQKKITKVVITVPAYFTDGQRQATVDAGEIAGFEVLEILNEPTAAAIAYKFKKINDDAKRVLIYDLGGGTFDVAVLEMKVDEIKVLAVDGDTHLGGEDFDKSLMEYCAKEFESKTGVDLFQGKDSSNKVEKDKTRAGIRRLQSYSEDRKKDLAQSSKTDIALDNVKNGEDLNVTVSRSTFESMNQNLFDKTLEIVDKALASARLSKRDIDDVVLVGGSTRIPKIQSMLQDHFGGKSLNHSIHPDEAVAYGAAVRAAMLNGASASPEYQSTTIRDVTPMSLGVEVLGGHLSVIINKGSDVPSEHEEQYTTVYSNQTEMAIKIYQGEEKVAKHNELLGEFILAGIPPNEARKEIAKIKMKIDKMGVLQVSATSVGSGSTNEVTVKSDKGRLSENDKRRLKDEEDARHTRYRSNTTDEDENSDSYTDSEGEGELWNY